MKASVMNAPASEEPRLVPESWPSSCCLAVAASPVPIPAAMGSAPALALGGVSVLHAGSHCRPCQDQAGAGLVRAPEGVSTLTPGAGRSRQAAPTCQDSWPPCLACHEVSPASGQALTRNLQKAMTRPGLAELELWVLAVQWGRTPACVSSEQVLQGLSLFPTGKRDRVVFL